MAVFLFGARITAAQFSSRSKISVSPARNSMQLQNIVITDER